MINEEKFTTELRQKFESYSPISNRSWEFIKEHIRFESVKRGEIVLMEGQISRKIYFVCSGAVLEVSYVTLQASLMGKRLYDKLGFKEDFILKNYILKQDI